MNTPVPTIGRIVLVTFSPEPRFPGEVPELKTRPGIVVRVWSDEMINVQVFTDGSNDNSGNVKWLTSVHLDQSEKPSTHTWRWMPYQIANPERGASKPAVPGAVVALMVVGLLALASGAFAWDATDSAMAQQMGAAAATAALGSATTMNPITIALAVLAAIIGPGVAWISSHFHAKNTAAIVGVANAAIAAGQAANAQHGANLSTVASAAGSAAVSAIIPAIESAVTKAVLGGQGPRPVAAGGTPWRNDAGIHPAPANPT